MSANGHWHFLPANRRLRHGDNREVKVGEMVTCKGPLVLCRRGLHASARAIDALQYAPGPIVCRVRLSGEVLSPEGEDKACATERTVLAMADAARVLHEWAIWCAERVLPLFEQQRPEDQRPRLALAARRQWLAGEITAAAGAAAWAAARDAAWAAARDAAWAAARAAARAAAGDAAGAAAWAAAGDAARDAAWAAARDAAWAAARDAARDAAWAAARAAARDAAWAAARDAARDAAWAAARDAAWAAARDAAWAAARDAAWEEQNAELEARLLGLLAEGERNTNKGPLVERLREKGSGSSTPSITTLGETPAKE